MIVEEITQPLSAWQNNYNLRPAWVKRCTVVRDGALFHVRQSGDQLVDISDWLVCNLDGEALWYTNEEFNKKFRKIK